MKKAAILLLIFVLAGTLKGECGSFDTEIKVNQEVSLDNDNLKIKFLRVVEDKRCPEGLDCYWSGYAKAEIVVNAGKVDYGHHFISNINNEAYNLANTISVSGYRIELKFSGIKPSRKFDSKKRIKIEVNPEDYVIQLFVTK
ncbi:MAG: hypothetical protein JRJ27_09130 [Deltaproteobacteria bacterium]|nr:hypothetical protein [Deltaproteobacteria bacterium]